MKKRLPALILALILALGLTACGPASPQDSADPSPDPSASPAIEADLSKSIVEFSAGLSPEDVLVTVNGEEITADLFSYLLASDCNNFLYQHYAYSGALPESLDEYADLLREDAVTVSTYYAVLRQKAAELGVPLTDEQRAEADAQLTEDTLAQLRGAYAFSDQSLDFISTLQFYNENVLSTVPAPTDEELNSYVYQTKHILLLTIDQSTRQPLSDEEKAEKLAAAQDLLARLQAVEGEEREALFDELMEEYSEDDRDADGHIDPNGYEAVLGRMVAPYETASLALDIGEMSGIVESEYGYHIILRGEVAFRDASREEYAEQYRSYRLDELMDEWAAGAQVTKADAVAAIDVDDFYSKYVAYQEAYAAAHPAESPSPAPEG